MGFPLEGTHGILYLATDTARIYEWVGAYLECGPGTATNTYNPTTTTTVEPTTTTTASPTTTTTNIPFAITSQPLNNYAGEYEDVSYIVTVAGGGTKTYQWQFYGPNLYFGGDDRNYDWRNIPNATSSTYITNGNKFYNFMTDYNNPFEQTPFGKLRCIITAEDGVTTLTSHEVRFIQLSPMHKPITQWVGGSTREGPNSGLNFQTYSAIQDESVLLYLSEYNYAGPDVSWYTGNDTTVKIQIATNGYTEDANWTDLYTQDFRGSYELSGYAISPDTGTKYYRVLVLNKWPYATNNGTDSATHSTQYIYPDFQNYILKVIWPPAITTTTTPEPTTTTTTTTTTAEPTTTTTTTTTAAPSSVPAYFVAANTAYGGKYCEDGAFTFAGVTRPKYTKAGTNYAIYYNGEPDILYWYIADVLNSEWIAGIYSTSSTPPVGQSSYWFNNDTGQDLFVSNDFYTTSATPTINNTYINYGVVYNGRPVYSLGGRELKYEASAGMWIIEDLDPDPDNPNRLYQNDSSANLPPLTGWFIVNGSSPPPTLNGPNC